MSSIVHNADCMDMLRTIADKTYDLALVDPPYGLGRRLSSGGAAFAGRSAAKLYKDSSQWDIKPSREYWNELFRVSKHQIVFGGNYFIEHLHASRGFIVWDKRQPLPQMSACELVWTSFDKPSKIFPCTAQNRQRFHPTQKPIEIYKFCLQYANAKPSWHILDTHLGSGASRIATHELGAHFVGIERDLSYFNLQEQRFQEYRNGKTVHTHHRRQRQPKHRSISSSNNASTKTNTWHQLRIF